MLSSDNQKAVRLPIFVLATSLCCAAVAAENAPDQLEFEKDILPIFKAKCIRCHAGVEPKAGLNLTSPSSLLSGGQSGSALRIRAAEFSLLYEKISSEEMPPVGQKLTAREKGLIRKWINDGAAGVSNATTIDHSDDITGVEHWAFRPPVRPDVPKVDGQHRVRNPIDAFVLRKLEQAGLTLAPEAGPLTLLRRVSLDLTGLPPPPDEVIRAAESKDVVAFEDVIERRLAQFQYGERWGRHWLDVAGYTDSAGILSEDRELPLSWRYRDYVIQAFHEDKPYDRFLQEQIAGDELTDYWTAFESMDTLPDDVVQGILATGFLRTASDPSRPDFKTIKNAAAQYYYPTLFDTLQIVCSSTMGLTVQCARCHSHKFDPIPQEDYYRMQAVFMAAYRPDHWVPQMERRLHIASKKQKEDAAKKNAEVDANIKALKDQREKLKLEFKDRIFKDRLAALPEQIRDDVGAALAAAEDARTDVQKYLVEKFSSHLRPAAEQLDKAFAQYEEFTTQSEALLKKIAAEEKRRWLFDEVRALYDLPGKTETPLLLRGDPLTPGPLVRPGALSALQTPEPFEWQEPGSDAKTSGRRLSFAKWLTQPQHPLTARVMVNRIWMHHFGRGIVSTPEDFGVSGSPPSHPELLDWLATEFVRSGWSVKHIHRLILTSSTWRQRSQPADEQRQKALRIDPENRLHWQFAIRRLDAEALRDSLLEVAGTLNREPFRNAMAVARQPNGEAVIPPGEDQNLRSVYIKVRRLHPHSMLLAFDMPTMSVNCTQRDTSTVSTQALTLLNSDMMSRVSESFADRVLREQPDQPAARAVVTAFSRRAKADELALLNAFLEEQQGRYVSESSEEEQNTPEAQRTARKKAVTDLCQMLLSSNEFAYVD